MTAAVAVAAVVCDAVAFNAAAATAAYHASIEFSIGGGRSVSRIYSVNNDLVVARAN